MSVIGALEVPAAGKFALDQIDPPASFILRAMNRRSRAISAVLAVLALLFAQMVASAHACGMQAAEAAAVVAGAAQDVPDCCDHGASSPKPACDAHCQQDKQAPERVQSATVMPLVVSGNAVPAIATSAVQVSFSSSPAPDLARDTQPPIPIRNCCFRI